MLLVLTACVPAEQTPAADQTASTRARTPTTADSTTTNSGVVTETRVPAASSNSLEGQYRPQFIQQACRFFVPETTPRCGYVEVPYDRSDANTHLIKLAVAVFPPRSEPTEPPLVYLEGGPGGETLSTLAFSYDGLVAPFDSNRSVVLFDQRGVGFSEPELSCPAAVTWIFDSLGSFEDPDGLINALDECRRQWEAQGIDLTHMSSADTAADLNDIRQAVGFSQWDLWGVSYGSRLALTTMRDFPEGVRRVVLDSTVPLEVTSRHSTLQNFDRALDKLFSACQTDPACQSQYGDLETLLFTQVEQLDAQPAQIIISDLLGGRSIPGMLTGTRLLDLVFLGMYDTRIIREIPAGLTAVRDGNLSQVENLYSFLLFANHFLSHGHYVSVLCNEEIPFEDQQVMEAAQAEFPRLANLVQDVFQNEQGISLCERWSSRPVDPRENLPVASEIPTLIVAGGFDPITPPEWGRIAARGLSNSWFVEFPNLAHGVATANSCATSITRGFLDGPVGPPDVSCIEQRPPFLFQ